MCSFELSIHDEGQTCSAKFPRLFPLSTPLLSLVCSPFARVVEGPAKAAESLCLGANPGKGHERERCAPSEGFDAERERAA